MNESAEAEDEDNDIYIFLNGQLMWGEYLQNIKNQ
jgi:hypothetical protein